MSGSAIGAERTDEELAAEDVGGNQLAVLEFPAWARIRAAGLEHAVLVAAEHGGLRAVDSLIDRPPAESEQHLAQQSLVA